MKNKAEEHNSSLIDDIFESISPREKRRTKSKMLLAAKIEDAMKSKGWNRTDLLKATGQKNPSVATKWFSGTHNFTFDTLFDIQEALGIDLINSSNLNEEVVVKYHLVVESTPSTQLPNDWNKNRLPSQIHSYNSSMIIGEA